MGLLETLVGRESGQSGQGRPDPTVSDVLNAVDLDRAKGYSGAPNRKDVNLPAEKDINLPSAKGAKPDPGIEAAQRQNETTMLSPIEEQLFKSWTKANGIKDYDAPDAHYDMRGFFKVTNGAVHPPGTVEHFPDTFKQHGHPTFSIESIYSKGPGDGGMWAGDQFIPAPQPTEPQTPEDTRSDTEKDPIRTAIDLMKEKNKAHSEVNKGRSIDTKQYELKHPKPKAKPAAK